MNKRSSYTVKVDREGNKDVLIKVHAVTKMSDDRHLLLHITKQMSLT